MSLNVYLRREEIPQGVQVIEQNDLYFNLETKLRNDEITKELLKLEGSEYNSEETFLSRNKNLGAMYRVNLSTGVKTILNVKEHPEKCFCLTECGKNIFEKFYLLTEGSVLWPHRLCVDLEGKACNIVMRGKHYTKYMEFLDDLFYQLQEVYQWNCAKL